MAAGSREFNYQPPGPVAADFMVSDKRVTGLRGPIGSGKSVSCAVAMVRDAMFQAPASDGIRYLRTAVVRNTNPQLRTTTIKTWQEWFNEDWGRFRWNVPYTHELEYGLPDGTSVAHEVIFLALDREADVKKLLSLELSSAWVNEAREVPKSIIDAIDSRLGRYPGVRLGGCTRPRLRMDTNAPPEDHWWPIMAGDVPPPEWMSEDEIATMVTPASWGFWSQPAAVLERRLDGRLVGYDINPERENRVGLRDDYYLDQVPGKRLGFINVYLRNLYQGLYDGQPVYPTFRRSVHVSPVALAPVSGLPIVVGLDFGRMPAAVFCQPLGGRFAVYREIIGFNTGAKRFAQRIRQEISKWGWDNFEFTFWGDPAGQELSQSDDNSPFRMMLAQGITVRKAPSNDPVVRIEAIEQILDRMYDGVPAMVVDPGCKLLIAGFEGGYKYLERSQSTHGENYYDGRVDKNRFSNPHDALQYAAQGAGEGRRALGGRSEAQSRTTVVKTRFNPFDRSLGGGRFGRRYGPRHGL